MRTALLIVALLIVASPALAADPPSFCHPTTSDKLCPAPVILQLSDAPTPFNCRLRYVGKQMVQNEPWWLYAKDSAPLTPCGPKQLADKYYARVCKAPIGTPIVLLRRYKP